MVFQASVEPARRGLDLDAPVDLADVAGLLEVRRLREGWADHDLGQPVEAGIQDVVAAHAGHHPGLVAQVMRTYLTR